MSELAYEVNFDGLVGPTHNYSGLSYGNVASESNTKNISNPKEAAKQGLAKMKALHDMGYKQGILLPQERPAISTLRALGFSGSDHEVLAKTAKLAPELLGVVTSASSMWTANAATVSPSADAEDGKVHFTPANLIAKFHRSIEHPTTHKILTSLFKDDRYFNHHEPLPSANQFGDEGAANHTRLCQHYGDKGVELFVYGRSAFNISIDQPKHYPARQTLEASQAIARKHKLASETVVFAQQNPAVIDAGVFHNDVIAVGNRNVLFYHEHAFLNTMAVMGELQAKLKQTALVPIQVPGEQVTVQDAVDSYLFNSQLLSIDDEKMLLVVPQECAENVRVKCYLDNLLEQNTPIESVQYFDLKQSMKNGGGPACLRLRVVLTAEELAAAHQQVMMSDQLYTRLLNWIESHYRDRLSQQDLADPQLLEESRAALDELTQILGLSSIYSFQNNG